MLLMLTDHRSNNRRSAFALGVLLVLMLLCGVVEAADQRPNVVLIIGDDQSWHHFGFMGNDEIQTPELDSLAEEGLLYERGYLPTALCRPSLATIATGLYPHQHGITGNDRKNVTSKNQKRHRLNKEIYKRFSKLSRLPAILSEHGYRTFQSGKWWEGSYENGGFTHGMTHGDPERGGRHGDRGLRIGRKTVKPLFDFIDTSLEKEKPFFAWYAPFMPHTPHNPPGEILKKYQKEGRSGKRAKYYAMCEWFDRTVGQIVDRLENRGIRNNTLIVFVSDNGWAPNTPGMYRPENYSGRWAARSKASPYENGIRTPIFFSMPERIEPVRNTEDLASSIDIMPTILDVVGINVPEHLPGISLTDPQAVQSRDAVFGANYAVTRMTPDEPSRTRQYRYIIDGWWKLLLRDSGIAGDYEWVHEWDRLPVRLYNLNTDPHERENVADQHPDVVERLRERLNNWRGPRTEK